MLVRMRALSFVLLAGACTSDSFNPGGPDGGDASAADVDADSSVQPDVVTKDAVTTDVWSGGDSSTTYCAAQTGYTFCDDFDAPSETQPWTKWDGHTSGVVFGIGSTGRGASVTAPGLATASMTKNEGTALHSLEIDVHLIGTVASSTLVRITSGSNTYAITTDPLGGNFIINGTGGSTQTFGPADSSWHHFHVVFVSGGAATTEDASKTASVSFPAATSYALDIGIVVTPTGGGTAIFDNVLIE
jgi:hypothetical protein